MRGDGSSPVAPGEKMSHYRLLEQIGAGGMGVVWKAEDLILGRIVAIKVLHPDKRRDEGRREMFLREARLTSSVSTAHIVQVFEFGRDRDLDFIVMEYVEGKPLSRIIRRATLPPTKIADYGYQVALALGKAHSKNLLHLDLKPANILVTEDDEIKVVDFGLATLFDPDQTVSLTQGPALPPQEDRRLAGTIPYMSPEQARMEELDHRSDIFSLGTILYEMTVGRHPFSQPTSLHTLDAIRAATPTPIHDILPQVPLELDRIIAKAMAPSRRNRYQDADDLAVDLKQLVQDLETGSSPSYETMQAGGRRLPRIQPWLLVSMFTAVLLVLSVVGFKHLWPRLSTGQSASSIPVIAVAPLANPAGDRTLDWYGEGIASLVRDNLALSRHVSVISRTPAQGHVAESDPGLVAAGVDYLVRGEILPQNGRLGLAIRIIDLPQQTIVASRRFDGLARDRLLAVSEPVAMLVRNELKIPSTEQIDVFSADFAVANPAAYETYLEGLRRLVDYRHEEAEESFQTALHLAPDFTMARYRLAQTQAAMGLTDQALINIKQALEESPRLTDRERRYAIAAEAYISRRYEEAARAYERLVADYPHDIEARAALALILDDMESYAEAAAHLKFLSQLESENTTIWAHLGGVYLRMKDCDRAREAVRHYRKLDPASSSSHHQAGEVHRCAGDFAAAAEEYETALRIDPDRHTVITSLAEVAILSGQHREAERRLKGLVADSEALPTDRIDAAFDLDFLYRAQGRFEEAGLGLEELRNEIATEQIREAMALAVRGLSLVELGDFEGARELIRLAIERSPGVPTRYLYARGILELRLRDTKAVLRTAEEIETHALPPNDPDRTEQKAAAYLRGRAHLLAGRAETALDELSRSVELSGYEYQHYRLGLARVLLVTGRHKEALTLAEQVETDIDPVNPRLDLQLDRVRAVLVQAEILSAKGDTTAAASHAKRFLDAWNEASASHPDLDRARRLVGS